MESTLLGLILDFGVLIAAERRKLTTTELIKNIRLASRQQREFIYLSAIC